MVVIGLLLSGAAFARAGDRPMLYAGWGGFTLGLVTVDVGELNDFLEPARLEGVSPIWMTLGGHAYGLMFERLVLGLRGGVSFYNEEDSLDAVATDGTGRSYHSEISLDLLAQHFQFDVGYVVINGKWGLAYPFVGLGGSTTRMKFEDDLWRLGLTLLDENEAGAVTPDSLTLRKSQMYTSLGFTYYFPVRFAESMGGGFGMFLPGVSSGVNLALIDTGWRDDGELVTGGPDLDFTGFFFRVEVAFGGGVVRSDDEAARH